MTSTFNSYQIAALISAGCIMTWWLINSSSLFRPEAAHHELNQKNIVLQSGPENCGQAVMEYMIRYYGRPYVKAAGSGPLSMKDMINIAGYHGLEAQGVFCALTDLPTLKLPCIVLLKNNHYVVLESISNVGYAVIMDPAAGRKRVSWEEFFTEWEGLTLLIHHPGPEHDRGWAPDP